MVLKKKKSGKRNMGTKEKMAAVTGSVSGATSILGSWQVCHNVCLGIIALLGILGITLIGMPLAFLQDIALPLWGVALIFLAITILLYFRKKCISTKMIAFNAGLIIAGTPLFPSFTAVFWIVGGLIVMISIIAYVSSRIEKNIRPKW